MLRKGQSFSFAVIAAIAIVIAALSLRCAPVASDVPAARPVSAPIADVQSSQTHLFRYVPAQASNIEHVYLAGDFNGWSSTATPMQRIGDAYQATLKLTEGVHYYKFVVDGRWVNDPRSRTDLEVPDNYGGKNSAVLIGLDVRMLPPPAPDKIDAAAIAFDPDETRDCNVVSDSMLRMSIRAQAGDVQSASIRVQSPAGWVATPLPRTETKMGFDRFGGVVIWSGAKEKTNLDRVGGNVTWPNVQTAHYIFELTKPGATIFVARSKAYSSEFAAQAACYDTVMHTSFQTPDWAKHAIWYQIFPERFRNGDPSNDPPNTQKWTSKWFAMHPGESGQFYHDVWARRYGGDIQGIRQELPYLRSLGVNAIYLNPIFQAVDLHKYDTSDYRHVDEHFGVKGGIGALKGETDDPASWQWTASDKVFLDFLADAHRQGFKVIIDGVFNHVGRKFWAFQDVIKNGRNSKYAGWFDITSWTPTANTPFHYRAWDGDNGALPVLKKDPRLGIAHGPREHIMAITRRWLAPDGDPSRGVDGFRLDAPQQISHPFWADWRQLVKSIKPDAYITGEIWEWAQPWLGGDQYDGVMNYQFAIASQQFFVNQRTGISVTGLNGWANQLVFNYPFQAALVHQNLLDSHDTDRLASMFVNPDLRYDSADRIQDNGPHYNPAKPNAVQRQRMLQEVAWQMTFAGAPMIYYGDEAGMWGPSDPSDRQPMIWKDLQPYDDPQVTFDQGKFDWYQRLIAIRARFPELQTGFFHPLIMDDAKGIYVFARDLGDRHVYIALNHADRPRLVRFQPTENSERFVDWLNPAEATVQQPGAAITARPQIMPADPASLLRADHQMLSLPMDAWGAVVITPAP